MKRCRSAIFVVACALLVAGALQLRLVHSQDEDPAPAPDAAAVAKANEATVRGLLATLFAGELKDDALTRFGHIDFVDLMPAGNAASFAAWSDSLSGLKQLNNLQWSITFVATTEDRVIVQGTLSGEHEGTSHNGTFLESFRLKDGKLIERAGHWHVVPPLPEVQVMTIPSWVLNIPSEPGQAFYGVGSAMYRNPATMDRAFKQADAAARRQIADTMKSVLAQAIRKYLQKIGVAADAVDSAVQDVTVRVTNFVLMGAAVVKRDAVLNRGQNLTEVYSLTRLGFDSAAESLHSEAAKVVEKLKPNHAMDFAALDALLAEAQKDMMPYSPPPSELPPIERHD